MRLHLAAAIAMASIAGGCSGRLAERPPEILAACRADLDGDHSIETVEITCAGRRDGHPVGGEITVLRSQGGRARPVWRQRRLNPWKLQIADVDGDGRKEIAVGVWKKSPKDPVMAKRVFVYSWNGRRLLPKWLGSRLGRRFDDFALADVNRDGWDELIALEIMPGGGHRIAAYRWASFGFEWLGSVPAAKDVVGLRPGGHGIEAVTAGGKRRQIGLSEVLQR